MNPMAALLSELFAIETDFEVDATKQRHGLTRLLESSSGKIWVAEKQARIVGLCTLQVLISTAQGGRVGLIEDVVVAKAHQRQGIGSRLLDAAEAWARANRLSRLQLAADRSNQGALAFYQTRGWGSTQLVVLRKLLEKVPR